MEDADDRKEKLESQEAISESSQLEIPLSNDRNEENKTASFRVDSSVDKTSTPSSTEILKTSFDETSNKSNLTESDEYPIVSALSNWTGGFRKLVVEQTTALYHLLNPDSNTSTEIQAESFKQKKDSVSGENRKNSSVEDSEVSKQSGVSNLQTLVSDKKTRDIGLFYSLIAEKDVTSFQTGSSNSLSRTLISPKPNDKNKLSELDMKQSSSEKGKKSKSSKLERKSRSSELEGKFKSSDLEQNLVSSELNRRSKSLKKSRKSKSNDSDKTPRQPKTNKETKVLESPLIPELLKSLRKMELQIENVIENQNSEEEAVSTNRPNKKVQLPDDSQNKIESYFNLFKETKSTLPPRESSDSGTLTPGSDDPDDSLSSKKPLKISKSKERRMKSKSKESSSKLSEITTKAPTKDILVERPKTPKLSITSDVSQLTDANVGSELLDQSVRSESSDSSERSKETKSLNKTNKPGLLFIPDFHNLFEQSILQDLSVRPKAQDPTVIPKTRDPSKRSKTQEPSVRPKVLDPSVRRKVQDPSVRSKVQDPSVRPKVLDPSVRPKIQDPSVRPKIQDPSVRPKIHDPSVRPKIQDPSIRPKIQDPSVRPKIQDPSVRPKVQDPSVRPKVQDPKVRQLKTKQNCMTDLKLKQYVFSRRSYFLEMQKNAKRAKAFMNKVAKLKHARPSDFQVANRRVKEVVFEWLKLLHYWDIVSEELNMIIETIDVLYISEENIFLNDDEFHIFMMQILRVFRDILELMCLCQNGLVKYTKLCFSHDMFLFLNHAITFESNIKPLFKIIRSESEEFTKFKKNQ